jgi:hypothetical protein
MIRRPLAISHQPSAISGTAEMAISRIAGLADG